MAFPPPPFLGRPQPLLHHVQVAGGAVRLAVTEWPAANNTTCCSGEEGGQVVVLIHATGFHSRCWDCIVRALPPTTRCLGVDLRAHGLSEKPIPEEGFCYPWKVLGEDLAEVLTFLKVRGAVGVGHSCGGWVVLHAALANRAFFSSLVLLDPVVHAKERYSSSGWQQLRSAALSPAAAPSPIARRRVEFETPQEMFDRLKDKPSYAAWVPEALRDYCFHGLLTKAVSLSLTHQTSSARSGGQLDEQQPREDMPLRLACPGWAEAATYAGSTKDSDRDRYSEITVPVTILRATKQATTPGSQGGDFRMSPTDPHLHKLFTAGNAVDVHLGEADAAGSREDWVSHFIPMQCPALVVDRIVAALQHSATAAAVATGAAAASKM